MLTASRPSRRRSRPAARTIFSFTSSLCESGVAHEMKVIIENTSLDDKGLGVPRAVPMMTIMQIASPSPDRPLLGFAALHLLLAITCLVWLLLPADPLGGEHPASKPFKFGVSIALFLATLAWIVPALDAPPVVRRGLGLVLGGSMLVETIPIVVQAFRGTRSHFNTATPLDAALWQTMVLAAVVATLAFFATALLASARPLLDASGARVDPLLAAAVRAGLWLLPVAAFVGFAMGGRLAHGVGGADGGAGLPLVGWSVRHGDLRVAHFFALHALQILPLTAIALRRLPLEEPARWVVLVGGMLAHVALLWLTLEQARAGTPFVSAAHLGSRRGVLPRDGDSARDEASEELGGQGTRWFYRHQLRLAFRAEERIDRRMQALGLDPGRVRGVIVTHRHGDHADALSVLRSERVYVGAADWPAHQGALVAHWPPAVVPTLVRATGRPFDEIPDSVPVTADGQLSVVLLSGHSPGHLGLVARADDGTRLLFAGDAVFSLEQLHGGVIAGICEAPRDARATLRVLERQLREHPTMLLPAHERDAWARLDAGRLSHAPDPRLERHASVARDAS